ncbi:aminotransferase class I/II-fold pyridoxal phosphate-dependent enzyme [Halobaculum sp. WSA2]|uniref:Aminotransferase n=1 Tax=Halobaculum saliterrae TaxID=2073113 RepID=A0A6B0SPM9_9EURY|nr:pyridoxal phosphate-dependent aminotransferase [Halobaculum saliterrae]MXR40874.1 aminotransferase class I/II-fold pyridoxal phosphate-dependent enzyme [Halobaculum saliterrae]
MFPPLAYLQWIEGRPAAAEHDLGSSDLRRPPDGDPDDPVPPRLRGRSAPSDGRSLREDVADEYGVGEANVLLTAGATHGGFLACAAAAALAREHHDDAPRDDGQTPADAVGGNGPRPCALVEMPGYEPLVETPRGVGTRVARFRRPGPEHGLDPERVATAARDLAGPLAHVTVTNRHNPTGALVDRATLAATAEVAADHGGYLLVDEVYAPYTGGTGGNDAIVGGDVRGSDDAPGDAFGGPTGAGLPATVTVGSLTKFHGLGGLRVGWITGPEAFIERARLVEHHVPALAAPSVALARRLFADLDDLVADARDHCRRNHELLAGFLADRDDLGGSVEPGSPFAYLEHERADGDAVSEAAWDAGVLVVPGRFFGMREGVRVSLGRAPDDCEAALEAFGRVLDGL